MCIPELLCPLGVSWLPPAPQPGARLSEKLAASLIFSNFTALKEMGNAGAAAPGKSLAGGVPALHSLSSWDWVTQPCRRQEPHPCPTCTGKDGSSACPVPPRLPPSVLPRASFLVLVPSLCKGHILLLPTDLFQGICSSRRGEMRNGVTRR